MPEAGSYTPKFKVGQTIVWSKCPDTEVIIFATYKGLSNFSDDYRIHCPVEFDESEPSHVMYAAWSDIQQNYYWVNEVDVSELVCSNCNRGKQMLLKPYNLQLIERWFNFNREGKEKYQQLLLNQPITDS